jgi:epoxyqueuosine reductase
MQRPPELFSSLSNILENYTSIISFIVPYFQSIPNDLPEEFVFALKNNTTLQGYGRIGRYAWGKDYHKIIRRRLKTILSELTTTYPNLIGRAFTDSVPILERALAQSAKLGFIGKNTLVITPRIGSFNFIGEIIWNANIKLDSPSLTIIDQNNTEKPGTQCKACQNCLSKCPTNALPTPGVLDAKRCIAYLTIEKRTSFTEEETSFLGNWVFGCDVCQDVCPFNHKNIPTTTIEEFLPNQGVGPFLKLRDILELNNHDEFIKYFAGTPLVRAKRAGLVRNSIAVLSNQKDLSCLKKVAELSKCDEAEIVRDEAKSFIRRNFHLLDGEDLRIAKNTLE